MDTHYQDSSSSSSSGGEVRPMSPVAQLFQDLIGQYPPRRGFGPWWVGLAVDAMTKSKSKTQIWMHSNPGLLADILNDSHRGAVMWVITMKIGPFSSESAADGFAAIWRQVSSKERESRILWGNILFDAYCNPYELTLTLCNPRSLTLTDEQRARLAERRQLAGKLKRARRGDPLSTRQRKWELLPEEERRVTCGDVKVRRDMREKLQKKRKNKKSG